MRSCLQNPSLFWLIPGGSSYTSYQFCQLLLFDPIGAGPQGGCSKLGFLHLYPEVASICRSSKYMLLQWLLAALNFERPPHRSVLRLLGRVRPMQDQFAGPSWHQARARKLWRGYLLSNSGSAEASYAISLQEPCGATRNLTLALQNLRLPFRP